MPSPGNVERSTSSVHSDDMSRIEGEKEAPSPESGVREPEYTVGGTSLAARDTKWCVPCLRVVRRPSKSAASNGYILLGK
jgi:hypothetical protein